MMKKRIFMSELGVLTGAVAVGFFKLAAFGVDPFQSFMSGMDQLIPIDFGTLYMIVNACMLLFALLFDRHYIGIATAVNLFLLGYVVQFSYDMLQLLFPDPSMALRVVSFIIGFVVLCIASSIYMTADLGVSTYDAVALIMAHKWKIGKFKFIRIITDLVCVALGRVLFLIGGGVWAEVPAFVGVGTIMAAFCMGPLIDYFNRTIALPMLHGRNK